MGTRKENLFFDIRGSTERVDVNSDFGLSETRRNPYRFRGKVYINTWRLFGRE